MSHPAAAEYFFYKGRVALYALLKVFGLGTGQRVLLPGYTCIVVPQAVHYLGAIPEYADIDPASYNALLADYTAAYERLARNGAAGSLRAVIIQHTYGNPNRDTAAIAAWARSKNLFVVEDCAHAQGLTVGGQPAGSWGDGAFFSLQWSKPLTTGLGGIAVLNRGECAAALGRLAAEAPPPPWHESLELALQLCAEAWLLWPSTYWFGLRLHRALARLGLFVGSSTPGELEGHMPARYFTRMGALPRWLYRRRLARLPRMIAHRVWVAGRYDELLAARGLPVFRREPGAVLLRYPLRVSDPAACLDAARRRGVELGDWFNHPLHPCHCRLEALNWREDACPHARAAAGAVVNLPTHLRIGARAAERGAGFVAEWLAAHGT